MNKKDNTSKHEFAFFLPQTTELLADLAPETTFVIHDAHLYHRITSVLRLSPGETFILFDKSNHAHCRLIPSKKKNEIHATLCSFSKNSVFQPHITFLLPILKREAFKEAIYTCAELGTTTIQPIITTHTQRKWSGKREHERLQAIVHAAAEQSKNFAFPEIKQPVSVETVVKKLKPEQNIRIFFDPDGEHLWKIMQELHNTNPSNLVLMIGPEADMSQGEKDLLRQNNFTFCTLTPTILRAQQAVAVSLGLFRSFL